MEINDADVFQPKDDIDEDDIIALTETLDDDDDIDTIQNELGITPHEWSDEMFALHIYHAVSQHMERGNHGMLTQMKAVNQCIKDLIGSSDINLAKISSESVKYSSMIDEWLVNNGYATRIQ